MNTTQPGARFSEDLEVLHAAIAGVLMIHESTEALMFSGRHQRIVQVCTGCGTDDGNWQRWPCPTISALNEARRS